MKKILPLFCVFLMVFAFGGVFCSDDSDSSGSSGCDEACANLLDICSDFPEVTAMGQSNCVDYCENGFDGEDGPPPDPWTDEEIACVAEGEDCQSVVDGPNSCFPDHQ